MKAVGILLLGYAAFEIFRRVLRAEKGRLAEAEGIYLLLARLQSDIGERGVPLFEIYQTFENEALAANGFLSVLRKEGLARALALYPPAVSADVRRELTLYAAELGGRFLEEERHSAARAVSVMAEGVRQLHAELPRKLKLKKTLFMTGTGMVFLFLL